MSKDKAYRLLRAVFMPSLFLVVVSSFTPLSGLHQNTAYAANLSAEAILGAKVDPVSTTIQKVLNDDSLGKGFFKDRSALVKFYQERNFEPVWVRPLGVTVEAHDLYKLVESSWTHGLNPKRYHFDKIKELINAGPGNHVADLELVFADAYMRLGADLSGIRVDPSALNTSREYWKQPLSGEELLTFIAAERSVLDVIESISPKGQTYKRLQQELKRLVSVPPPVYEEVLPIEMDGVLYPYQRHDSIKALRQRFGLSLEVSDPYLYDDQLAGAIIQFQRDHSLKPDGIIGEQTLDVMNIKRSDKIEQIIANLERLRWVDEARPSKFVTVNIPSATLWAVEDNRVAFEMPVIVGRKKRPTNIFITEIHGVRFNPNWTVPPTIKKKDILPQLQEDPTYLNNKGMELISGHGSEAVSVDPASVDWVNLSNSELHSFRMVQNPGRNNPLGRVRVLMPNKYNIYLHDTNHPEYFQKSSRALSSGCVRLKDPELMAEFIMKRKSGWGYEKIQAVLGSGEMSDNYIQDTIPVYLLYYTVWINEKGDLVYGRDLYDNDKKLIKILSNLDGIFIPVDNT